MTDTRKPRAEKRTPIAAAPGAARGRTLFALSEEETMDIGRNVARSLRGGEILLLEGDLGLGKTVFARGVAAGLGIAPEDVSSPSFTLVQEYGGGRLPMFHVDLYRLAGPADIETLGLDDYVAAKGVVVVEWGERLDLSFRREALLIRFHDVGEGSRRIEIVESC